jgi:pilus assembly protein CpaF
VTESGWEVITPFLSAVEHLILDPEVSEIMRNNDGRIYAERAGIRTLVDVELPEDKLLKAVEHIARLLGSDISEQQPLLDARLPDGSRVSAVLPPVAPEGITLNIRKLNPNKYTLEELERIGAVTQAEREIICGAIAAKKNVLVSGGTSTGKTSTVNAFSPYLGDVRIVVIEDTRELQLHQQNVVRLVAQKKLGNHPEVTIRELLRMALRQAPDRIIVGEVRGGEAFELLSALNSGHDGSMATVHASSPERAIRKLARYAMYAGEGVPLQMIEEEIAESIQMVVHLRRDHDTGRRYVQEIVEIEDYERKAGEFVFSTLTQKEKSCAQRA